MKRGINILLASSKYMPEYSGSGFRAHSLYKRLLNKEQSITGIIVLSGSETENQSSCYTYEGFEVNRIAEKRFLKLSRNPLLRRFQILNNFHREFKASMNFLNKLNPIPNMIHIFGKNYVTAAAMHYAISNSIPLLIELCNEMNSTNFYTPFPIQLLLNLSPKKKFKYICISERLKKVCLSEGISEENLWCRPNPIDENKFFPVSSEQKLELRRKITNWGPDVKLLCYIAKIIPRKNHLMLIDVIEKLPDNYRLFMGGPTVSSGIEYQRDSALVAKIEKEISERKLSSKVIFKTGFFKNIDQLYKMSDVYLFPTKEEGLGTPLLEAISCAIPVVANTINGITDTWIEDGKNGYLSSLDPNDFVSKIIKAERIHRCNLLKSARKIIDIAGISVIDQQYINIINNITRAEE